ncbi:flagellar basal body rod protein FlgB [Alteromonas sp. 5E99-2]|uniref:flagellar basal body rod protein FlgB n=1 Tax=Alteromonas sp. 5E99-2 TaxID=2817683 RepID=UPI001A9881D8|nr:flagellar basal body rod protein FlgB [Alteromonas sp. 5E99-2]
MAISLDKLTAFSQRAVNLREDRMEVIAGNLANANTPGYKAKDFNFRDAMTSATVNSSNSLTRTNAKHMSGGVETGYTEQYRIPQQADTGDGNTVEVQTERNAFLDNGLRYQASLQFLDGKFQGMKKAITGGQ